MQLKKYKPCAAIFCFMVLALTATHLCAAETPPPEGTLAQVNGVAITKGELDMELNRVKKQAQMKHIPGHGMNADFRRHIPARQEAPKKRHHRTTACRTPRY